MSLGQKLDIEPLNDARWSRIEKSLFERLDRQDEPLAPPSPASELAPVRSWRAKGFAIGALALAAAVLLVVMGVRMWPSPSPRSVVAANPSRIVTGASDSHLALGESSIDVGPESALVVSGDDARGLVVVLDRGKVTCEVAPRGARPAFVVQAGDVRVRVIGTRFTVTRVHDDGRDTAKVEVAHGVVEVSAHGTMTMVRSGETWPAGTTADLSVVPTDAPLTQAPTPTPTVSADDPTQPKPSNGAKRPTPNATTSRPSAPITNDPYTAPAPTTEPAVLPPPSPSPSPRQLYEQAAQLESRDPSRALAIYRELAAAGGAWGMNALFAQGRLQADRGNRGEARRLLNDYLSRYPRGPNAADARALLDRLK